MPDPPCSQTAIVDGWCGRDRQSPAVDLAYQAPFGVAGAHLRLAQPARHRAIAHFRNRAALRERHPRREQRALARQTAVGIVRAARGFGGAGKFLPISEPDPVLSPRSFTPFFDPVLCLILHESVSAADTGVDVRGLVRHRPGPRRGRRAAEGAIRSLKKEQRCGAKLSLTLRFYPDSGRDTEKRGALQAA